MTATLRSAPPGRQAVAVPPPAGRWGAGVGAAAAFVSMLVVVALWVANGGIRQLGGDAGEATSALGRLTGLVAADLLLLQVLLMARVPRIERAFGQDRLARWHRWTGFSSFHLMVAHIVLITVGYALAERVDVVRELWVLTAGYPGMLLAAAGTVLLVMVVVTSVRAARRRLRYESWHLLHLYAYLGAGLALPHQLWTGADFVASGWSRAYWWTLYAAAAGAVLAYRVGLPRMADLAAPARRRPGRGRRAGADLGVPERPAPARAAGAGRAVLPVAVPGRAGLVAGASVLAVGDAAHRGAAHHGEGPRRRQRPRRRAAARDQGPDRRAVRHAHRRVVHRRPGRHAGLRHRGHPAAGAARGAAVRAGAGDAGVPGAQRGRGRVPRRAGVAGAPARGPGRVPARPARHPPVLAAGVGRGARRRRGAAPVRARGRRRRRVHLRARRVDRRRLTQETLAAQSADIDTVSGATVTSDGYKRSLQAALDAAHLS